MFARRVIATLFLTAAVLVGPGFAQTSQPTGGRLRVASWNLLNLFDNHDHPEKPDEGTAPKSVAELKVMARVIDALDADVLGVQEVENREVLERLNRHLRRPYVFVELIEGNDVRGIDVGILSRVPIVRAASHRLLELEGKHRFARDFPTFRLRPSEGVLVDVGVVHLKSKRGKKTESDAWRRAEAEAIRTIATRRPKDDPSLGLIVLGDFNDLRDSGPLSGLLSSMTDHTARIPVEDRFTYVYRGKGQQIDFVVSTPGLESSSARIHRDIDGASDHFPVVVDFRLPAPAERLSGPRGLEITAPDRPLVRATDLNALERHLLKEVEVEGKVSMVYRPKGAKSASLNFHRDYKKAVIGYVPRTALARLGDLDRLVGKTIRLRGPVSKHRGKLQIVLTRPEQLTE